MNRFAASTEEQPANVVWFYTLAFLCLLAVCATHPFLKLPYDPWEHLVKIRSIYDTGQCFLYWPENLSSFCSWHRTWATIFSWLSIDDALTWASVIHCTQFILALVCVYYFSRSVISLISKDRSADQISMAAVWSTLFWLIGNGTYSIAYQQAWIMWYSVTYQGATIPLFWLITAMALQIFFDENASRMKQQVLSVCIVAGLFVITAFHPSESVYFFIFFVLCLIFTPRLTFRKKILVFLILAMLIPCALFIIDSFYRLPFVRLLDSRSEIISFVQLVEKTGSSIVENGGNRIGNSFSELAVFASLIALVYWLFILFRSSEDSKLVITLLVAAIVIFYLIPVNKWLAGTTGVILHKNIVWRFFFGSPWFLIIPLAVMRISSSFRFPKCTCSLLLLAITAGSVYASYNHLNHALAGNVQSLINAFSRSVVGLQYSEENLGQFKQAIDDQTDGYDKEHILLYLRGDLASLARALYGYYTFSHRRVFIPMHKFYADGLDKRYKLIPVVIPSDFPKDPHVFKYFNLDVRAISQGTKVDLAGTSKVIYHLGSTDVGKRYAFITGWAFLDSQQGKPETLITLESDVKSYIFDSSELFRQDVGEHYDLALDSPGFVATIAVRDVLPGEYRVGLQVKQNNNQGLIITDRTLKIHKETTK